MLSPDTVLQARYKIVRQLGQGGMGAVYEAVDERLDTIVALKETLFADEKLRKQFEREARLLARMHHPALPRVSDHFNEDDGQFLVMQYIAGDDLATMLAQRKRPFPQEEVLVWADQLCDALDYLHTQDPQIIHRDIKPQNLKLTTRGQVVLLDFGLAKGSAGQMSVVTTSASIFGYTPNYAPLEQIQGLGTDPRSDIYALSATLYHLITNTKPPDALSRASAIVNGLTDPLSPANRVTAQVSGAVAAALDKGMSQKRDDRFETANAMREALRLASERPLGAAETLLIGGVTADAKAGTVASELETQVAGDRTSPFGSEARTLIAGKDTHIRRPTSIGEAATVVRSASGAKGSRKWLGAALLLVLIAGGAGGFYVYRARRQAQQNANPTAESPAQPSEANQPAKESPVESIEVNPKPDEPKIEKKAEASRRAGTSKRSADKSETSTNEQPGSPPSTTHDAERNTGRNDNPNPNPPSNPLPKPPGRQPGHPPGTGETTVKTLPNGTRIVTQPDGTRIVTGPKGNVRVIPPGERRGPKKREP